MPQLDAESQQPEEKHNEISSRNLSNRNDGRSLGALATLSGGLFLLGALGAVSLQHITAEKTRLEEQLGARVKEFNEITKRIRGEQDNIGVIQVQPELQQVLQFTLRSKESIRLFEDLLQFKVRPELNVDLYLRDQSLRSNDEFPHQSEYIEALNAAKQSALETLSEASTIYSDFVVNAPSDRLTVLSAIARTEIEVVARGVEDRTLNNELKRRSLFSESTGSFSEPLLRARLALENLEHALLTK